jgi:hypothetical protein
MALRRWISLARYDGAQMLVAAQCPPDGRNRLVVRGYARSDLSAHGFGKREDGLWIADRPSFKTSELFAWFPGFDPRRDIVEMDTGDFLIGYEDLDLIDDNATLDAFLLKGASTVPATRDAAVPAASRENSAQYENYREHIEKSGGQIPAGMVEQINLDERLNDGEAEKLLDLLKLAPLANSTPELAEDTSEKPRAQISEEDAQKPRKSFHELAEQTRSAVDPAEVAAITAQFPREYADKPFDEPVDDKARGWYLKDFALPRKPAAALEKIAALQEATRATLQTSVDRYNDIRERNVYALSDYDIQIAYQFSAVNGVHQALSLKVAHILYDRRKLVVLEEAAAAIHAETSAASKKADRPKAEPTEPQSSEPAPGVEEPEIEEPEVEEPAVEEPAVEEPKLDIAARPRRAVKSAERQRQRIEDAGEKIGGARKDFYAKALAIADLDAMNDREKLELVGKDNIWPRRSYGEYREAGVDARVALFLNAMRRDLPAKITDAEHAPVYIEFVTKLRDIAATVTRSDALEDREEESFFRALVKGGLLYEEVSGEPGTSSRRRTMGLDPRYQVLFQHSKGWQFIDAYMYSPSRGYRKAKSLYDSHYQQIGDQRVSGYSLNSDALYDLIESKQDKANERRARSMKARETDDESHYLSRPHLDHLVRSGLPDDRDGRDVNPDDFLETFGFRACEFGNWLPDIERQDVLNRAYDSLSTLARVLSVEKTFLSLDGSLALAFGSRGIGKALAHYEPARKVINLTRLKGAGSLAHEFFHALDDHLANHVRQAVKDASYGGRVSSSYFSTELFLSEKRATRSSSSAGIAQSRYVPTDLKERLKPLVDVVNSMSLRTLTEDEARIVAGNALNRTFYSLVGGIRSALFVLVPSKEAQARNELAQRYAQTAWQEIEQGNAPRMGHGIQHPLVERLAAMQPEQRLNRSETSSLREALQATNEVLRSAPAAFALAKDRDALLASELMTQIARTKYFSDAEKLDEGKSKVYWSSVRELAARAFESYVQDRCEKQGQRDDYLVHGTEEERFVGATRSPYPTGADREAINAAFDGFVAFMRRELVPDAEAEFTENHFARPRAA